MTTFTKVMRLNRTRAKRTGWTALLAISALLLGACAEDAPQDYLEPAGEIARNADRLWDLTFTIAAIIFFIVEALLIFAIVRFRRKPGREPAQFHGNTKLEVLLTLVPALILAGVAIPTVRTIFGNAQAGPAGSLQVTVTGRQFWWEYEYPEYGVVTANELHIPTGERIYLTIKGGDVNHSWWAPKLGGKQDVVPGRENRLIIHADAPGEYLGQCTEYCGDSHANMRLKVFAHDPADFETWIAEQQEPPPEDGGDALVAEGREVFQNGPCINCHAVDPSVGGLTGPNLAHYGSRTTLAAGTYENTDANLAAWLDDPPAMKPDVLMPDYGLTAEQIDALVAYLQSLE